MQLCVRGRECTVNDQNRWTVCGLMRVGEKKKERENEIENL